jgi:hypothetical protein
MTTDITELAQRVKTEASAIDDTQWYLAKPSEIRLLVEALEKAQQEHRLHAARLISEKALLKERIAELEEAEQKLCAANVTLDTRAELAERQLAEMESRTATADADVSDRNQPGVVVAVHVDAGDFVKVEGQVYEVEETDFDDHDVTLWFVGGETLKCAAGCQIEVVSAPEETE